MTRLVLSALSALMLFVAVPSLQAQAVGDEYLSRRRAVSNTPPAGVETPNPERLAGPTTAGHTWIEIAFGCSVLVFGIVLVGIEAWLAFRGKLSESAAFKLIGLTIVITGGLFVIPAGFSQNQMTPLMGLLGAVAGYLLGKDGSKKDSEAPPDASKGQPP